MTTLAAILIIFLMLAAWVTVQQAARNFAARHPEFGPAREEGGGCGFLCRGRNTCALHSAGICSGENEDQSPTNHSRNREEPS